jgi:hypothetical protein
VPDPAVPPPLDPNAPPALEDTIDGQNMPASTLDFIRQFQAKMDEWQAIQDRTAMLDARYAHGGGRGTDNRSGT